MLEDESYKDDKKLDNDIKNMNYPPALSDLYEFIEEKYKSEIVSKKK